MAKPHKKAFGSQMAPWPDWEELDERAAVNRLQELADKVRRTSTERVGRVAVIGIANYSLETSKDWPELLGLASALAHEFEDPSSPRIGR